ncbi:patatin-like protein [Saccharothrix sp.]|uniref:patatin-like protein n=1 Tax=Saccharothrix sp. TaxID=1873460 RepID=UPI0028115408|nr:patatin-like protein [Saccharothrix sp.]
MRQEIRFAVILNGGVSSAVWMGGAVLEVDRLSKGHGHYWHLLDLVNCSARADVVCGTSAGGINGAALALAQLNDRADLSRLRDVWVDEGHMEEMLRTPFEGEPVSLLKGDDYVLPRLREALNRLTVDATRAETGDRPMDLRITTTLLPGIPYLAQDDLGQAVVRSRYPASFSFRRDPRPDGRDDFAGLAESQLIDQLALAARASASFPFAFEPAFIPVDPGAWTEAIDMSSVASWSDGASPRSRHAVDGGLLANAPVREVLGAIDRMPAEGPVRRTVLLVSPQTAPDDVFQASKAGAPPSAFGAAARLLSAMADQNTQRFATGIYEHNRRAAAVRAGRVNVLRRVIVEASGNPDDAVDRMYGLAATLYGVYEDLRIRHTAQDVAALRMEMGVGGLPGFTYERMRADIEVAQRQWLYRNRLLPYVDREPPPSPLPESGWPWGMSTALELVSSAMDLLKRLAWVVPDDDAPLVARARAQLHDVKAQLRELRRELNQIMPGPTEVLDATSWSFWLEAYAAQMLEPGEKKKSVGARVREQVQRIGDAVEVVHNVVTSLDEQRVRLGGLVEWRTLLVAEPTTAESAAGVDGGPALWLSRLIAWDVAATCLSERAGGRLDEPAELVDVTLQTTPPFAETSRTPADKVGSTSLSRLSGFLKRSWRVNDWIWGRLDTATILCRVLFDPRRLHLLDRLNPGSESTDPRERADRFVDQLVETMFGGSLPEIAGTIARARQELTGIYTADDPSDLPPTARELADLAAWGLHVHIITEELPALRMAILADRKESGSRHTRGELFLEAHQSLLDSIDGAGIDASPTTRAAIGIRALRAFDKAGISREPLDEEVRSDHMIRMAVTAGSVALTVADSENSGLAPAKPLTRAVRGAALLPYWTINRLTSGRKWAHLLGLVDVIVSGGLLVLAVFNLLPAAATGPAAALGGAWLLAAVGYSALRTGTLLHALVLLSPVLPLIGVALGRAQTSVAATPTAKEAVTTGAVALGGVALIVLALIILGSLPTPIRPPLSAALAWLRDFRFVSSLLPRVLLVAALCAAFWVVVRYRLYRMDWLTPPAWATVVATVAVMVFGGWATFRATRGLQRWTLRSGAWVQSPAEAPAIATAGWAFVYGCAYLLVVDALLLSGLRFPGWQAVLGTALVFGLSLTLVVGWLLPLRARRDIIRQLIRQAPDLGYSPSIQEALQARLADRAQLYRFLVERDAEGQLRPTKATARLAHRIARSWHG